MRKSVSILIAAVLMMVLLLSGCAQGAGDKTFTVGFDKEFPPMGFVAEDGSYTGFDIDLAKETAKRMGMEVTLQPIDWDSKDMELDTGNIDCVWNGFTINGRETEYEWTKPYMNNNQIVVVMKDSTINTFADIKDKVVAVQEDSSALTAIDNNADFKSLPKELVKTDTNLNALMELESGAADAVVMDEIVARYMVEKKGENYKVLDEVVGAEEFGVGFKKGNTALRDQVEKTLTEMAKDGTLAKISSDWFGKDITTIGK